MTETPMQRLRTLSMMKPAREQVIEATAKVLEFAEFMHAIFDIFGFDYCDQIFYRTDAEYAPLYVAVNVSDVFEWGTADGEEITPADIPALRQSKVDAREAGEEFYFGELYAARRRKRRPQGAFYNDRHTPIPPQLAALFNECGPEREQTLLNPQKQRAEVKFGGTQAD